MLNTGFKPMPSTCAQYAYARCRRCTVPTFASNKNHIIIIIKYTAQSYTMSVFCRPYLFSKYLYLIIHPDLDSTNRKNINPPNQPSSSNSESSSQVLDAAWRKCQPPCEERSRRWFEHTSIRVYQSEYRWRLRISPFPAVP